MAPSWYGFEVQKLTWLQVQKKQKKNMDSRIMGTFRNGHFLSAWILLWVWMTTVPSSMWSILKRGLQLSFSYQVCQNRMKRSQVIGSSVQEF